MSECTCTRTEVRERTIRGGSVQHVRQCLDCGEAVGGAVKQTGPVPKFDEGMRARLVQGHITAREDKRAADKLAWSAAYAQYLESPEWANLRSRVLSRDGNLCQGCLDKPATEVHHLSYANVGKEFAFELLSLCSACHTRFHEQGEKE